MIHTFDIGQFANPPRIAKEWPPATEGEIEASIPVARGFGAPGGPDMHKCWQEETAGDEYSARFGDSA
jgi:hypothetical protein